MVTASPGGPQFRIAALSRPGDLFGELAYLSNDPHGATVQATTPATVLKIDASLERTLLDEHLDHFESVLDRFLTNLLASRLKKTSSHLAPSRDEPRVYEL